MNKLESAKIIESQGGDCCGIECIDCVCYKNGSCCTASSTYQETHKLAIAKQYIKEHDMDQPKHPKATPEQPASIRQLHETIDTRQAKITAALAHAKVENQVSNDLYREARDELKAELRELKRIKRAI